MPREGTEQIPGQERKTAVYLYRLQARLQQCGGLFTAIEAYELVSRGIGEQFTQ
jgi:hypothetical protein